MVSHASLVPVPHAQSALVWPNPKERNRRRRILDRSVFRAWQVQYMQHLHRAIASQRKSDDDGRNMVGDMNEQSTQHQSKKL